MVLIMQALCGSIRNSAMRTAGRAFQSTVGHSRIKNLVIGASPEGIACAHELSRLGREVTLVDTAYRREALKYASGIFSNTVIKDAASLDNLRGSSATPALERFVKITAGQLECERVLQAAGIETGRGKASFISPNEVSVSLDGKETNRITADRVFIATGTKADKGTTLPYNGTTIVDKAHLLASTRFQEEVTIIGNDISDLEIATLYANLGATRVDYVQRGGQFSGIDTSLVSRLIQKLSEKPNFVFHSDVKNVGVQELDSHSVRVYIDGKEIECNAVVLSPKQVPNVNASNLQVIGVSVDEDGIETDQFYQTRVPNVFAVGAVVKRLGDNLTPPEQARLSVRKALETDTSKTQAFDPSIHYTSPPIAQVSFRKQDLYQDISEHILEVNGNSISVTEDTKSGDVIAVNIVGEGAPDLIQRARGNENLTALALISLFSH